MPIDRLLATLQSDAGRQAAAIRAAAAAEAAAIHDAATARAASDRDEALHGLEDAERRVTGVNLGEARMRAMRLLLDARRRLLERVFHAAARRCAAGSATRLETAALRSRVARAVRCAGAGGVTLRCAPAAATQVRESLAGTELAARVAFAADASLGPGFVMTSDDGRLTIDETLAARLSRRRVRLAQDVLRRIETGAA